MRKGYDGNTVQETAREVMDAPDFASNRELLARAKAHGGESDDAMRATEELIEANRGLVKKIALRFVGRGVELDDLLQIGTIGLIKAIRSFELERGTQLSTYAVPLIFGEIHTFVTHVTTGVKNVYKYFGIKNANNLITENVISRTNIHNITCRFVDLLNLQLLIQNNKSVRSIIYNDIREAFCLVFKERQAH